MPTTGWLSVLTSELAMAPGFVAELDRQLRAQALRAGVQLGDLDYKLLPRDRTFTPRFLTSGGKAIGLIEGDLVDPAANGHRVALAWRSTRAPEQPVEPGGDATDLEFFWVEFPSDELSAGTRVDTSGAEARLQAPFPVEWDVHHWSSVSLQWYAQREFGADEIAVLTTALADAMRRWNHRGQSRIQYLAEPELSPDRRIATYYVDLGAAGADAVIALINAAAASSAADAIARGRVGRRG